MVYDCFHSLCLYCNRYELVSVKVYYHQINQDDNCPSSEPCACGDSLTIGNTKLCGELTRSANFTLAGTAILNFVSGDQQGQQAARGFFLSYQGKEMSTCRVLWDTCYKRHPKRGE